MTIPSWARKGARVVCIKRNAWTPEGHNQFSEGVPQFRGIYTIRKVVVLGVGDYLALEEIEGMHCFRIDRFRPLVDDANDSEIEAQIYRKKVHQNGAPVKELVRT